MKETFRVLVIMIAMIVTVILMGQLLIMSPQSPDQSNLDLVLSYCNLKASSHKFNLKKSPSKAAAMNQLDMRTVWKFLKSKFNN
jgi:hypothetical protein